MNDRSRFPEFIHGYGARQRLGAIIRARRQDKGIPLSELGRQTGISVSHLSRIERGLVLPSYEFAWQISAALAMDFELLMQREADAVKVDVELEGWYERVNLSIASRQDLLRLSPDTRVELLSAFRRLSGPEPGPVNLKEEAQTGQGKAKGTRARSSRSMRPGPSRTGLMASAGSPRSRPSS